MIVRERLTGERRRRRAQRSSICGVRSIEERAGRDLDRLERAIDDQRALRQRRARSARLPRHGRGLGSSEADEDDEASDEQRTSGDETGQDGEGQRDESADTAQTQTTEAAEARATPRSRPRTRTAGEFDDRGRWPNSAKATRRPTRSARRPRRAQTSRAARLSSLHPQIRRDHRRRGAVRAGGTGAAARLSRQAIAASAGASSARLANRLQRRLLAQQNRSWEFDLEEGMLDPARLPRIIIDPHAAALLQAREGHRLPRHGGDAAARQFRLDARPADHGGGDVRRHSGPHAGALRRQGRDSRLHHASLEGRPIARGLAAGRQAGQSRPTQRPAPHHLQGRRRAVAPGAEKSRPDDARGPAEGEHRRRGARLGAQAPAGAAGAAARS